MKVSELSGVLLDLWVAKATGMDFVMHKGHPATFTEFDPEGHANEHNVEEWRNYYWFQPSTDWRDGGPIIERERIDIIDRGNEWAAGKDASISSSGEGQGYVDWIEMSNECTGPTPLIAAMRAFVASKYGDEVPDEPGDAA